jgi:hypothetical protein
MAEPMALRILTVRQPWAWAIIHGGKHVENRVRNIAGDYRGPLAIHAGLASDKDNEASRAHRAAHGSETETRLHFGAIIGVVNLWAVHQHDGTQRFLCCPNAPDKYQRWAQPDMWHLCFANPRALAKPLAWKGALGMRTLPDEVEKQIMRQVNP